MTNVYTAFVQQVLSERSIPQVWPQSVINQAKNVPLSVRDEDRKGRKDLTRLPFVTIDGENSRDFDDAVYAEKTANGWQLYVAIADVSWYVRPETPVDREAFSRGNSVYFPQVMVAMLPDAYCTGICSLNPHEDRLCIVCEMNIEGNGRMKNYQFYPAVINSHDRLTYHEVQAMISGKQQTINRHRVVYPHVYHLYETAEAMRLASAQNRPLSLQNTEPVYQMSSDGSKVKSLTIEKQTEAHWMIEACMVAANNAAARFIREHRMELIYRAEDGPLPEKLTEFRGMISSLPETLDGGSSPSLKNIGSFLKSIKGKAYEDVLIKLLLRHQTKAVYTTAHTDHYLLGISEYTHFTSPIRRYVDLTIHRIIRHCMEMDRKKTQNSRAVPEKAAQSKTAAVSGYHGVSGLMRGLFGKLAGGKAGATGLGAGPANAVSGNPVTGNNQNNTPTASLKTYSRDYLEQVAQRCNETEKRAQEAWFQINKWLNAAFMSDKNGQVFRGAIIATREFGLFVHLAEYCMDIFVYIGTLGNERFNFFPTNYVIRGQNSYNSYHIGQTVDVEIVEVNVAEGKVRGILK
ncbi:ribonuclease R family protein [Succinimonas sp.]|uniref:ribonuclease R family protein n=1 Tax=Succinimonas sp. TaxID=1936151 RepID=UPI00386E7DEF